MPRYIDADAYILEINDRIKEAHKWGNDAIIRNDEEIKLRAEQAIATFCEASLTAKKMPTADVQPVVHGKWVEKHHAYSDEENPIEEWQSCKCSECGRYDTRPYLYYFSEPRFCSWCGADMRGEQDA